MPVQSASIGFGAADAPESAGPLPLRMLVVADFLGRRLAIDEPPDTRLWRIDKNTFNDVLGRLAPHLLLELPNRLGGPDKSIVFDYTIRRFEDLRPEAVAAGHPATAALMGLRAKIQELAGHGLPPGQIAARIEDEAAAIPDGAQLMAALTSGGGQAPASGPSGAPASGGGSGSVLDEILAASEPPRPASSSIGSVISAIGAGAKRAGDRGPSGPAGPALAWIDERVGRQVEAVLQSPEFMRIEEAWRGLRFLIERVDFRKPIVIDLLPSAKEDLRAVLLQGALEAEWQQPTDPPLSVILVDHLFDRTARDMDLLQELAQAAEQLQAPAIAEAGAAFFGLDELGRLGARASLHDVLSDPQYAKWFGVRRSEPARWLALTVNRFLLRRPWGEPESELKGLQWREPCDEPRGQGLRWGAAVWALGACIARSFASQGWPHFISGPRQGGMVEDLSLRAWEARPGVTARIPLETGLSDMQAQDLAGAGLIPLQAAANTDKAYFTYVPSAHAPRRYADPGATQEAAMMALLPYQLYAGRVAAWLNRIAAQEAGAPDAQTLAARLKAHALELLATASGPAPESCVTTRVEDSPDHPDRYRVTLELRPPFKLFNLTPRLELTLELRK